MQITHAEARQLIQFHMDQGLKPHEENMLQTHLNDCRECRSFAEEIKELESILLPTMKRHWNLEPAPLSIAFIIENKTSRWLTSILLTTRTVLISIVFVAFVLSAWQFTRSNNRTSNPMPASDLPIPTPSEQSTSTKISLPNCEERLYPVQENDTLESIALRFSVSKEKIMSINNMSDETVRNKMDLLIPICASTPTGTIHPSTLTLTFTPLGGPTTATPGG